MAALPAFNIAHEGLHHNSFIGLQPQMAQATCLKADQQPSLQQALQTMIGLSPVDLAMLNSLMKARQTFVGSHPTLTSSPQAAGFLSGVPIPVPLSGKPMEVYEPQRSPSPAKPLSPGQARPPLLQPISYHTHQGTKASLLNCASSDALNTIPEDIQASGVKPAPPTQPPACAGPLANFKKEWTMHSRSSSAEFSTNTTINIAPPCVAVAPVPLPHLTPASPVAGGMFLSAVPISAPDAMEISTPQGMIPIVALGGCSSPPIDSLIDGGSEGAPPAAAGSGDGDGNLGELGKRLLSRGDSMELDLAAVYKSICDEDEDWSFLDGLATDPSLEGSDALPDNTITTPPTPADKVLKQKGSVNLDALPALVVPSPSPAVPLSGVFTGQPISDKEAAALVGSHGVAQHQPTTGVLASGIEPQTPEKAIGAPGLMKRVTSGSASPSGSLACDLKIKIKAQGGVSKPPVPCTKVNRNLTRLVQGSDQPTTKFFLPNPNNPEDPLEEVSCRLLFSKELTATDTSRNLGRIILPRAAAENYLPPCNVKEGVEFNVRDTNGYYHTLLLKFWNNGRPIPKKMYLLDCCQPLMEFMRLKEKDLLEFYLTAAGKYVINNRRNRA